MKTQTEKDLREIAKIYVPGNKSNIRQVIEQIMEKGEILPSEIAKNLGKSSTTISIIMKPLREMGLVKYRKEGTRWYYSLKDPQHLKDMEARINDLVGEWLLYLDVKDDEWAYDMGEPIAEKPVAEEPKEKRGWFIPRM